MTANNDFLPLAGGGGANVISQAAYAGSTSLLANGFQSGTAQSNQVNKVLRQTSAIAALIGQFMQAQGQNANDDGNASALLTNFEAAMAAYITATSNPFTTGDAKITFKTTADTGWIMANDQTIGSASSSATYANANAQALFTLLWTNVGSAYAPISGGYGASAAADWAANKAMSIPKTLGRALAVAGTGTGGNATAHPLGSVVGDEALASHGHTVNDPTHTHGISALGPNIAGSGGGLTSGGNFPAPYIVANSTGISINNTGAGTSGNMQPSTFVNFMIKL